MEKIRRYHSPVGWEQESEDGDLVQYDDHIKVLRELFPRWPGKYPTEGGHYYIKNDRGEVSVLNVCFSDGVLMSDNWVVRDHMYPDQFGPRVPMWRMV